MHEKKYTCHLFLIQSSLLYAQGKSNIWTFGYGAGIDFNSGSPVSIPANTENTEGTASICDGDGSLLSYTDGQKVWNKEHNLMPGGSMIIPTFPGSTNQACVIVKKSASDNLYYIFHWKK